MQPSGRYFIDGKDFWTIFSVIVESGSDDFLKYPSKKESITRDWSDANGLDIDTSQVYLNARDISLRCAILADSEEDFWSKYNGFLKQLTLPGSHRIQLAEFGLRSFYCVYKETPFFERFTRVRIEESGDIKVACKFGITLIDFEPRIENGDEFIVDEEGRFLIT